MDSTKALISPEKVKITELRPTLVSKMLLFSYPRAKWTILAEYSFRFIAAHLS